MKKPLITINEFIFFIILIFMIIVANNQMLNSQVLPQIRAGEWMIENGKLLDIDIFSYTMSGREWTNINWLAQLIFAFFYSEFGLRGVITLSAFIITSSFALIIYYHGRIKGNVVFVLPYIMLGILATSIQWLAMPFTFNFLFLIFYFIATDLYFKQKSKLIYLIPLIQMLWVNINSEYIFGYLILALYFVGKIADDLFIKHKKVFFDKNDRVFIVVVLLAAAAVLVNPYGMDLLKKTYVWYREIFVFRMGDWASPNFHNDYFRIVGYFFALNLIIIFLFKKKIGFEYIFIIVFWQVMFFYSQRNISIYILFSTLIFGQFFEGKILNMEKKLGEKIENVNIHYHDSKQFLLRPYFVFLIIGFLVVFNGAIEKKYPTEIPEDVVKAVRYLKSNNLNENIICTDMHGNLLIWENWPEQKVFLDNRPNFYSMELMNNYAKIYGLKENWEKIIEQYKGKIIIEKRNTSFDFFLAMYDSNWIKVYEDNISVIFLRKDYYDSVKDGIKIELLANSGER